MESGMEHGEAGGSVTARVSAVLWLGARRQLAIRVGNGAARARLLFKGAGGMENTANGEDGAVTDSQRHNLLGRVGAEHDAR